MNIPSFCALYDHNSTVVQAAVRAELTRGLLADHASVSPKYLYDTLGSRLFDAITALPEYYPTRVEAAIIAQQLPAIGQTIPRGCALIDLGAGSCEKATQLFGALQPAHYIPVDISVDYLRQTLLCLQREYPQMQMSGVGMDFSCEMLLPNELMARISSLPIVVFYPGSSIGNFSPDQARDLLFRTRTLCTQGAVGGGLLIGVDLVKPRDILEPAYDDPLGVTAAFNLNMLLNINHLLASNFNPKDWKHLAFFDSQQSRIEMHLKARRCVTVEWPGYTRNFQEGECIHTENSYKWTVSDFSRLLQSAGFSSAQSWSDEQDWFAMLWARA